MALDLAALLGAAFEAMDPAHDVPAAARALEAVLAPRLHAAEARVLAFEPGGEMRGGDGRIARDAKLIAKVRATGQIQRGVSSDHPLAEARERLLAQGVAALVAVPLLARGALRGVLLLGAVPGSEAAGLADASLLAIGGAAAAALEQARLVEAMRVRVDVQRTLLEAARFAASCTELDAVLDRHADALARIARATRCGIALPDPRSERALVLRAVYAATDEDRAALRALRLDRDATVIARAWMSKRLVVAERERARSSSTRRLLDAAGGSTLAALPLVAGGAVRGVAFMARAGELDEETRTLLEAVGNEVALAIEAAEERERARRAAERAAVEAQVRTAVHDSFDLDRILAGAVERLGRALHAHRCVVGLPDPRDPTTMVMVHEHRDPPSLPSALSWRFTRPDRATARAVDGAARPVVVTDVLTDPRFGSMDVIAPGDYRSFVLASFVTRQLAWGGLAVAELEPRRWTDDEVRLVAAIADQCAIAVERARLHEDARRRADELELVLARMTDGLAMCDERLTIVRVNAAARQILFGRLDAPTPLATLLERIELLDVDLSPLSLDEAPIVRAARRGETTRNRPLVVRDRASGKERWLSCSATPIQDGAGARLGALCVFRDVTAERAAAEHASRTEKLRVVGELAASVAHELNNTLAAVLGRAEFIQQSSAEAETQRSAEVIASAARDSTVVLGRLTRLSRKPPACGPRSRVDLVQLVNDAVELTRPRWSRVPRASVTLAPVRERILTLGFATELREVFTNLILNAVDALAEGGSVRVTLEAREPNVLVSVADTGCGMSDAVLARAFEPFFTTKGDVGTGLGLNICSSIVSEHGGRIEVRSTPGQGTTIEVSLPLAKDEDTPRQPTIVAAPLRLLVVDDDARVRAVLADTLAREGHLVQTAGSGEEALALFEAAAEKPGALLTDISMPGMSGIHLAEEISARAPRTAIVLVSGWATSATDEAVERLGAALVTKPFATVDVRGALVRALALRRL